MSPIPCHNTLESVAGSVSNPGLFFDRFMKYPTASFNRCQEEDQRPHLSDTIKKMSAAEINGKAFLSQWFPPTLPMRIHWRQKTIWRMALHLSKAASSENAAICLHHVYGFPYIPGTGLKGMTRAYAHLELGKKEDDPDIQRIFGSLDSGAGTVIFHDAWPANWPELELDIVNSHHPNYYKNEGVNSAPGDWENPVPVFFLTLAAESEFRFAVSPSSSGKDHYDDMQLAAEWLQKALQDLGAGAKTAAGYGYFHEAQRVDERMEAPSQDTDALSKAIEQLKSLDKKSKEDGGYTHTKHFDQLQQSAEAVALARGGILYPEDVQLIQQITEDKFKEKRIRKLIDNLGK